MRYRHHAVHPLTSWAGIAALLASILFSFPTEAATYTVTNLNDSGPGSLRQAVLDANASIITVDTINFDPTISGVIKLTSGEINITDRKLTINGPGRDILAISGNKKSRIFYISSTATGTTIQDLTLQEGDPPRSGDAWNEGAALANVSMLTLNRIAFSQHTDCYSVLYNTGTLKATNLWMQSNPCRAIYNDGGTFTATQLNLWQNTSSDGAGIYNNGNLTLTDSLLVANAANEDGGGIYHRNGIGIVRNTTFSGNNANGSGGGIYLYDGNLTLTNCSLIDNSAVEWGGGIENNRGDLTLGNTIISNNLATKGSELGEYDGYDDARFDNSFISLGHNLIGINGDSGIYGLDDNIKLADTDIVLASAADMAFSTLEDNGGNSYTHALVAGSQAIDAGNNDLVPAELTTDQRGVGFPRIVGDRVDIGAFEAGDGAAPTAYPLTITLAGKGNVTSAPTGLTCSDTTCSGSFPIDEEVTLTAKPLTGFTFSGWSGACTNKTGTCAVTMSKAQTVTATFTAVPVNYSLTLTKVGNGTVTSSPTGINCGTGTGCSAKFARGKTVMLTAVPATGATFVKWTGCIASATNSKQCTLTLTANKTVTATFTSLPVATVDFIITNINLSPAAPTANGVFEAKITVKNQGTSSADGGTLSVWTNRTAQPVCSTGGDKAVMVGTVGAGKTKILTIKSLAAGAAGSKKLYAFVDSKCVVSEKSEINNWRAQAYTVTK